MRLPAAPPAPHLLAAATCGGLAFALVARVPALVLPIFAGALAVAALAAGRARAPLLALALCSAAWWWGSVRLEAIDRSALVHEVGTAALARVEVTAPGRTGRFTTRVPVRVRSYDDRSVDEPAQLEIPASERAPPQGALLEVVAEVRAPRPGDPGESYDEARHLGRKGIHVVLHAGGYQVVGRRGGLAGVADRIREYLAGSIAPGLSGERRALVTGIVLGEEQGLDGQLRDAFRASGLYHVLAVSGQNVAYVVGAFC